MYRLARRSGFDHPAIARAFLRGWGALDLVDRLGEYWSWENDDATRVLLEQLLRHNGWGSTAAPSQSSEHGSPGILGHGRKGVLPR